MAQLPIVFLHGALGAASQLQPLVDLMQADRTCYLFSFHGHGGLAPNPEQFNIEGFANQVLNYLQDHNLEKVQFFGYSMGGYIASWLAIHHPEKVDKIVTLATKWEWSPEGAEKETKMLQPAVIQEKVPQFAAALAKRHAPESWEQQMELTAQMMRQMGENPPIQPAHFHQIQKPVLLLLGDKDRMVTQQETEQVQGKIPNAELKILANTPHPFEKVNLDILASELKSTFA